MSVRHPLLASCAPSLLAVLIACMLDPVVDDPEPPDPELPDPAEPGITVNVAGDIQFLPWDDTPTLTETEGLSILTFDARDNLATLTGVMSDTSPLAVGSYPLGLWGSEAQVTAIAVGGLFAGEANAWAVGEDPAPGELVIDAMDRDAGLLSLHFSGEFRDADGNPIQVEAETVQAPLVVEAL